MTRVMRDNDALAPQILVPSCYYKAGRGWHIMGLGKATALGLAHLRACVVMACRDVTRGEADRAESVVAFAGSGVKVMDPDLVSEQFVRVMAESFKAAHAWLEVLINNASVFKCKRAITPDGLETMFATNYLGHFLLTNLLLNELKVSSQSHARIINITAPSTTRLDFDDLQGQRIFSALWPSLWRRSQAPTLLGR